MLQSRWSCNMQTDTSRSNELLPDRTRAERTRLSLQSIFFACCLFVFSVIPIIENAKLVTKESSWSKHTFVVRLEKISHSPTAIDSDEEERYESIKAAKDDDAVEQAAESQPNKKLSENFANEEPQRGNEKAKKIPEPLPEATTDLMKRKMNVVLFYADDWSFNMIGATNPYVKTPYLDQLAKEGVLFTHNCVVASICMQSRATLYTGQYSSRHKTYKSFSDIVMYEPERWKNTLYPLMMQEGYEVGFYGKYHHLEPPPPEIPTFSRFRSVPYLHYFKRGGVEKHCTQWAEEDAFEFLDNRPQDKPFFLTISFFATHAEDSLAQYRPMNSSMHLYADEPFPLPKTYTDKHWNDMPHFLKGLTDGRMRYLLRYATSKQYQQNMKNTCRMITEVDTAIGNVIRKLKDQGVYDNTVIIFTTDNGNFHGQHGLAEKWYAYEESLRVPLIIKDPRMPNEMIGTNNSEFTLNIDLAPTILSAGGVAVPDVMQGRDIAKLYLDAKAASASWRKEFLYEFHYDNDWIPDSIALVNKDFKYIYWDTNNYTQFFNLKEDPYEEYDLFNITEKRLLEEAWKRLDELNKVLTTDRTF